MTIAGIEAAIKARLNRDTPTVSDNIREWVSQRQRQILRTKNFGFMWTTADITLLDGTQNYALPERFKDDYAMWFEKYNVRSRITTAEMQSLNQLYSTIAEGAQPFYYYLRKDSYDLYPIPDAVAAGGKVVLEYYEYLDDFAAGADGDDATNYLTENYPDLLINGGTAEGFGVLGQVEEIQLYEAKYTVLLKECQEDDNEKSFSLVESFAPNADARRIPEEGRVL